jgi:hypothetical protein
MVSTKRNAYLLKEGVSKKDFEDCEYRCNDKYGVKYTDVPDPDDNSCRVSVFVSFENPKYVDFNVLGHRTDKRLKLKDFIGDLIEKKLVYKSIYKWVDCEEDFPSIY